LILKDFTDPVKNRTIWGNTANGQYLDFGSSGLSQNRVSEIIGNTNFGNIDTLISQGYDMEFIAGHYNMDLPLLWALRLKRKTDQEKLKEHERWFFCGIEKSC